MARGIALDLSRPFLKVSRSKKYVTPQLVMSVYIGRKFRSQTSDHLDKWKSRGGRVREEKRRSDKTREEERARRKKMQVCKKEEKSRDAVFFRRFGAPKGRKVGSLKRRVRSHLAKREIKSCTPLWREARFEVKMYKTTHHARSTFGSCNVRKVHAVVARSTFRSQMCKTPRVRSTFGSCDVKKVHAVVVRTTFRCQNAQNTSCWGHFWKLRCGKSVHRCGAKHISKSKCTKHHMFGPLLNVQMSFRVADARDCAPCPKSAKREIFVANSKTMAGVGHLKRIRKMHFAWQARYMRHVHQRC